jgi:hypothetical protein
LQENTRQEKEHRKFGAIIIDARRPLSEVVEEVVKQA